VFRPLRRGPLRRDFGRRVQSGRWDRLGQIRENFFRRFREAGFDESRIQELYDQALQKGIDKTTPRLVETLLRDAPKMLRRHGRYRRGFERRLRRRWRRALDLYYVVYVCCEESGGEFNQRYREQAAQENDFAFEALTRLHARACLVASEVYALLRTGHAAGAEARWRTLHEVAVVSSAVGQRDNDVAQRYLDHQDIEAADDAEEYQRYHERLEYEPLDEATLNELRERRHKLLKKHGRAFGRGHYGWAAPLFDGKPPEFSELEKLAGLDHLRPFRDLGTRRVHAGARGTGMGLLRRGPHLILQSGPTNYGLAESGHGSLISLSQTTITLLIYGRPKIEDPMHVVVASSILALLEKAGDAFLAAHRRLKEDEAKLWKDSAKGPISAN
jgi:hypothetical protein